MLFYQKLYFEQGWGQLIGCFSSFVRKKQPVSLLELSRVIISIKLPTSYMQVLSAEKFQAVCLVRSFPIVVRVPSREQTALSTRCPVLTSRLLFMSESKIEIFTGDVTQQ